MKIALITFDYYGYDSYIRQSLEKDFQVDAIHIDFSKIQYRYSSILERLYNFYLKSFHNRNIKKEFIEKQILQQLGEVHYDQILIIRPDRLSVDCIKKIKQKTSTLISYIYDSSSRFPITPIIESQLFDTIFVFDEADSIAYDLPHLNNYIFWDKEPISKYNTYDLFLISSIDERLPVLNTIARTLVEKGKNIKFTLVGKRKAREIDATIFVTKEKQSLENIKPLMQQSFALLDLVRDNQVGLSFRVFESLALQKKFITNNKSITKMDFYNPNNIFTLEKELLEIPDEFWETSYEAIPDAIYNQYTVKTWVKTVFNL